jgi:hypothetical protein
MEVQVHSLILWLVVVSVVTGNRKYAQIAAPAGKTQQKLEASQAVRL